MIISLILQWINSDEIDTPFPTHPITNSELAKEQTQIKKINRQLIAQARLAKLESSTFTDQEKLERSHQLLSFIGFSMDYMKGNDSDLVFSTLGYLLAMPQENQPPKFKEKILFLFKQLINKDKEAAIDFYNQNTADFANHNEVNLLVARITKLDKTLPIVRQRLAELNHALKHQENPLGLGNLIKEEFIDNTEAYAAFILWLIQCRVPVRKIIATHLLHDFMRYNLSYLDLPESEINHLYDILKMFPEAQALVAEAKTVSCGERGFLKFALDGSRGEGLRQVEAQPVVWAFSPTADNFTALAELFSHSFLPAALIWFVHTKNLAWFDSLYNYLNKPSVITSQLPALINYVGRQAKTELSEVLASLINDSTAGQLAANHDGAILYLLAYKPALIQQIQIQDVKAYIEQMAAATNLDTIMQLSILLKRLVSFEHPSASIVFEALVDNFYHQPQLLDDDKLVRQLKYYPAWSHQLKSRCNFLHVQLASSIEENTNDELDSSRYNSIEDVWLEINRKLAVIYRLDPQPHAEPRNKYFLLAQIACASHRKLGSNFNIDRFVDALSLPDPTSEEGKSLHERTLIEVLTAIDDEPIRKQIIAKLEGNPISCLDWMTKEYGETSIFIKAAAQGNEGLLRLINTQNRVKKPCLNAAVLAAARSGHWATASSLCQIVPKKISRETLSKILILAAQAGEIALVKQICDRKTYVSITAAYPQGIEVATINNHLSIVKQIYASPSYKPSKSMSEKLFHVALKYKHFSIATYLCDDLPKAIAPHEVHINNAFKQAIINNDIDTVICLANLTKLRPKQFVFAQGFKAAASLGLNSMLSCLSSLPGAVVDKSLLEKSLIEAATQGHVTTLIALLKMTPPNTKKRAIVLSLQAATRAEHLVITKLICEQSSPSKALQQAIDSLLVWAIQSNKPQAVDLFCKLATNRPRPRALAKALAEAIKKGHFDFVISICKALSPVGKECINDSILLAVNHQRTDILAFLYELPENKPNPKFIRIALERAQTTQQKELVNYLQLKLKELKEEKNVSQPLGSFGVFKVKANGEQLQASAPSLGH